MLLVARHSKSSGGLHYSDKGWPGQSTFFISPHVKHGDPAHRRQIIPTHIGDRALMDFMIAVCTKSKDRSLELFPVNNPNQWNRDLLPGLTRDIFADAIADLTSVWLWVWTTSA